MARGTCWVGYEQKGMKFKKGKRVPNCVKKASEGKYMDESKAHESKESKAQEARETRLEKKGYVETKSGKMKKVQKAYTGRAIRQPTETDTEFEIRHEYHAPFKGPQKASLGALIGAGADKILKNSQTARDITSNLGIGGNMLSNYYNDLDDKKVEEKSTTQQVAKAYEGKFIEVELDGTKYSNASKKNYYKGMI
jgi:hypothetical protein